jgi:hypothetical protein
MTIRAETTLTDQTAQETQGLSPGDLRLLIPDFERSLRAPRSPQSDGGPGLLDSWISPARPRK